MAKVKNLALSILVMLAINSASAQAPGLAWAYLLGSGDAMSSKIAVDNNGDIIWQVHF